MDGWRAAAAALAMIALPAGLSAQILRARVDGGIVAGARRGAVTAFLGVPYAATTAGANRWRAPQPVAAWTGTRPAAAFGPNCMQEPAAPPPDSPWTAEYLPSGPMSEDCLSLNVWTPARTAAARLPVMVWVHGGAFTGGSGSVPIYDGAAFARRDIVVVTINYRLGVFGFLAHPWLTGEAGSSGNYGLMDQVAALAWVRRNIARFGGDPAQVTLAGQSAGAASTHYLLAAPSAAGLFRRVIAQSGSGVGFHLATPAEAEATGERIAAATGAGDIAALRATPPDRLIRASHGPGMRLTPVRGGPFLPDPAAERTDVPVLTGLTRDENSADSASYLVSDPQALTALRVRLFGAEAARFATLYPGRPRDAAQTMLRDRGIAALTDWADRRPRSAAPAYAYLFSHPEPGPGSARFGAFHSAEIPYVFGTLAAAPRPFGAADHRLSAVMGRYWAAFIRTGTPAVPGLPSWPSIATGRLLVFGAGRPHTEPALPRDKADAFRGSARGGGALGLFAHD